MSPTFRLSRQVIGTEDQNRWACLRGEKRVIVVVTSKMGEGDSCPGLLIVRVITLEAREMESADPASPCCQRYAHLCRRGDGTCHR